MKISITLIAFLLSVINIYSQQIPQYYQNINLLQTGDNLKNELTYLITQTHTTILPYTSSSMTDVWDAVKTADENPNNTQEVLLLYGYNNSDNIDDTDRSRAKNLSCHQTPCTGYWNREHVFPKSLGNPNLGTENAGSDAHSLRPVDGDRNSMRSNRKFAQGTGNSHITNQGYWYPGDEWKGDVARMIMYMFIRYPSQCEAINVGESSITYAPNNDMPDIFLEWNADDPVSQFEIDRNIALANIQGNRNPFIDNPYLATLIWSGPQAEDNWNLEVQNNTLENVKLSPNPVNEELFIHNTTHLKLVFTIYSLQGKKVNTYSNPTSIKIDYLTPGLYLIKIESENNITYKKISVN